MINEERTAAATAPRETVTVVPKREARGARRLAWFTTMALVALVAFVAGTRSDELYAAIAPVFGVKVSSDTLDTGILQRTFRELKANYDGKLDMNALADGAARGMTEAAGDRYTAFMDKEEAEQFAKDLDGEISGIGSEIGLRSSLPTILRVVPGSPAERAGVKGGDIIIGINNELVVEPDVSSIVERIRGEPGTSVKLSVRRDDATHDFTITREKVSDPSVRVSDENGVGTITITRFDDQTTSLARRAASDLKAKNVRAVVLDLRDNGGGYLDAATGVSGIWLDNKVVVTEKAGDIKIDEIRTGRDPILAGVKTVVLVNGGSASASEIVAGALQDHGVATLVGEKTFGKGTVQKMINLPEGRLLKVTIARWFTPKGKNITKEGITPEKIVPLTSEDVNAGRDPQRDAALELIDR